MKNEIEQYTQLGTGESFKGHNCEDGDDAPLNIEAAIARFKEKTRLRLRHETSAYYVSTFRRFAKVCRLSDITRRQLSGSLGKSLLIKFFEEEIPIPSRRYVNAGMKTFWEEGFGLPYPVNSRKDLGKLPRPMRRESPQDAVIRKWVEAIRYEKDPYLRLVQLLIFQHGWRPSHASKLKWRNVRYSPDEKPCAIIANGAVEGFKTNAPIIAHLSDDVVQAILEVQQLIGTGCSENPILPFRSSKGEIFKEKEQRVDAYRAWWERFEEKHNLPHLRMVDVRHWVATTCRKVVLSKQASAGLMGHDSSEGGAMRDWYDAPPIEDILAEQMTMMPNGPIGVLCPAMEVSDSMPKEVADLVSAYMAGKVSTFEFANTMESHRLKQMEKQAASALEP
jgi:hypothetical protein